jgi:hypothetical protein
MGSGVAITLDDTGIWRKNQHEPRIKNASGHLVALAGFIMMRYTAVRKAV